MQARLLLRNPEPGSVIGYRFPIVSARQDLQGIHVDRVGQGDNLAVGKEELADVRDASCRTCSGTDPSLSPAPPRFHLAGPAIGSNCGGSLHSISRLLPTLARSRPTWTQNECFSPTRNVWLSPSVIVFEGRLCLRERDLIARIDLGMAEHMARTRHSGLSTMAL